MAATVDNMKQQIREAAIEGGLLRHEDMSTEHVIAADFPLEQKLAAAVARIPKRIKWAAARGKTQVDILWIDLTDVVRPAEAGSDERCRVEWLRPGSLPALVADACRQLGLGMMIESDVRGCYGWTHGAQLWIHMPGVWPEVTAKAEAAAQAS